MKVGCTIKQLPKNLHQHAARVATAINPVNAPPRAHLVALGVADLPQAIAMLTTKYWGHEVPRLRVQFLDQPSKAVKTRLLLHMNAWDCGIEFIDTRGVGQVRIARGRGGYWSYLGTDILSVPRNQQTMNLEGFTAATAESEWHRVVRHETGHCLAGSTLIDCPRDLTKYPLGIPINELVGTKPWVYAWKDGRIVVRQAARVWLARKNAPTVRVVLRTGRGYHHGKFRPPLELVGTTDHPVLLSDGKTWKNLGDLRAGDRLCSMYRSKNGQRSRVTWTGLGSNGRVPEHVLVAEQVYGDRPEGHDCHHKDENKMNQSVENLEWKDEFSHHSDHSRGKVLSEEHIAKLVQASRDRVYTPELRAKLSASHTGKKMSEEAKARLSAATKGIPQSPELIEKRRQAMIRFYANGGRSGMYGKKDSDETRLKKSESAKVAKRRRAVNHVVVSVEPWLSQDVYDMTVPDAESFVANGVVVHNCLGFPHEHLRAAEVAKIDPAKAYAYFSRTQGWDKATIDSNVLTPLSEASLMSTLADETSVMCYQLPGSIMRDGKPIVGGNDINATDRAFAQRVYPKAGQETSVPVADLVSA